MASRGRRGGEDELMAVVIAKYTRDRAEAKRLIWLMQYRCNKEHEKITSTLFDWNAATERKYAYKMIDEAGNGSYFYRFVISPDPVKEDTHRESIFDFRELTVHTMMDLEKLLSRYIDWVAALHDEDKSKRHVISIAVVNRRINREELMNLTQMATNNAIWQKKLQDEFLAAKTKKEWPIERLKKKMINKKTIHAN
jgi:hypothetical protein